ncbi:hypothetical protein [Kordiimonas pumila]|uniref:Sulfotransferase family protein n=1 Tax=Kordiimonas pumila TaxID=2161677 RepID=A0ABV7D6R0_9PROT|nr:hypothetical protein [Kordiimonas pumila]
MTKKLILHIGMHKTGTSALQQSLHKAQKILLQHDIHYPNIRENHSVPFYRMFTETPENYVMNTIQGVEGHQDLNHVKNTDLKQWSRYLGSIKESLTIISGEGLTRLPLINVSNLKAFLLQFFDDIKVIAYCRPPISYIQTMTQQQIRMGNPMVRALENPPLPEYRAKLQPYIDIFGAKNVLCRPFAKELLHNNCIVADMLSTIEKDTTPALIQKIRVYNNNQSLTWPGIVLMDIFNKLFPHQIKGKVNKNRSPILVSYALRLKGPEFRIHSSILEPYLKAMEEDTDWVSKQLGTNLNMLDIEPDSNIPCQYDRYIQDSQSETVLALARLANAIEPPIKISSERPQD